MTPGVAYDLITASGGISGTFTTVNQAASVLGFLRYTTTSLQLLGTFVAPAGMSVQATASLDYVNAVLVGGKGSAALLAAVPSLLSGAGTGDPAAFARINPEAYASASQLGIEHGQMLARAGRVGLVVTNREEAGLFTFAQGLGGWQRIKDKSGRGISGVENENYGALGGVRHQLDGARTSARAGFTGTTTSFSVFGAGRAETVATAGAGVSVDVAPRLSLYGTYLGEFGNGHSHNANIGVRFAF